MDPILLLGLLLGSALASEPAEPAAPAVEASLHGDVKLFFLAGKARPWFGLSEDALTLFAAFGLDEEEALTEAGLSPEPFAQGVASARLKGVAALGPVRLDAAWAVAARNADGSSSPVGFGTGVGASAPELLPLSWAPDTGSGLTVLHRIDRLVLSAKLPHVDLALGRQPVSLGVGQVFTPMDLVNPFHPATIDSEYKPGVDALRVDAYAGTSGKLTVVGAWAGQPILGEDAVDPADPVLEDLVLAASGQVTVGVTDLIGFVGEVRAEPVFGVGTASSAGPIGLHGEATLTLPSGDEPPFLRAVAGADGRPTSKTTLSGELYVQTFGADAPEGYLDMLGSARVERGEVWALGRRYGSLAVAQEITPLVYGSLAVISNLGDPSALLAVSGSWSVADNADLVFGGYRGLGLPPDEVLFDVVLDPAGGGLTVVPPSDTALAGSVNSEFGLYPTMGYVQMRAYF